jgi:tetratricopeptide (TPR) repeat protein
MNRRLGSRIVEAFVLANLALSHQRLHDFGQAREMLELALSIDREVGNRIHEGVVLTNLGEIEAKQRRHAEARQCFEAALARHRETGNRLYMGVTSGALARTLLATAQPLAALPVLDEGERLLRAIDNPVELRELLAVRGQVCHALGDITGAREALHECEAIVTSTGAESRIDSEAVALARLLSIGA